MKQKIIHCVILLNKCKDCQEKFKPKKSMVDEIFCDDCLVKRENIGNYAGVKCNLGHYGVFAYNPYPKRVMAYCEKCRCYFVPKKTLKENRKTPDWTEQEKRIATKAEKLRDEGRLPGN